MSLFGLKDEELTQLGGILGSMPTFSGRSNPMANVAPWMLQAQQRAQVEEDRRLKKEAYDREVKRQAQQDQAKRQGAFLLSPEANQAPSLFANQNPTERAQSMFSTGLLADSPALMSHAQNLLKPKKDAYTTVGKDSRLYKNGQLLPGQEQRPQQPGFEGKSVPSQAMNIVTEYNLKKQAGKSTTQREDMLYNLATQQLTKEQRYTDPSGQMFTTPGLNLSGFASPSIPLATNQPKAQQATIEQGREKLGAPKLAPDHLLSAGFAETMVAASQTLNDMTSGGFDPASVWEKVKGNAPVFGNFAASPEFQQYETAKGNWVRAKLRRESGATIGDKEAQDEIKTYFPVAGDSEEVIKQKKAQRLIATKAMIRSAQSAYKTGKDDSEKKRLGNKYGISFQ